VPQLDRFVVFDGEMVYLFIGYGNPEEKHGVQKVWVYDVAEGRALKKYDLELPLESLVAGEKRGEAYATRSHGDNVNQIFEFKAESDQTQPEAWPLRGRMVVVERRYPQFRLYHNF